MGRESGHPLAPETVARVMRRHFVALAPHDSGLEAYQIMRLARLRTAPVVQQEVLVGVVSFLELLHACLDRRLRAADGLPRAVLESLRVQAVMTPPGAILRPDTELPIAASQLSGEHAGWLPVAEASPHGPRLIGLVTETDLLIAAYATAWQRA
jgi:CBS-domain-containing membrane protein